MSKTEKTKDSLGFHLLIAAAGSGSRTGLDYPKQYVDLCGKAVLRHTLDKFIGFQGLKSIRIITGPGHEDLYAKAVAGLPLSPPVMGADTRRGSIYNGLCTFTVDEQDDIVLIQDAARPFVTKSSIQNLLDAMAGGAKAATLATPIADTIVHADSHAPVDRNSLRAIQTPQAFRIRDIKAAHETFIDDTSFTDDAGLMKACGYSITCVDGTRDNFKITTAEDLIMAEHIFAANMQTITGYGYDVHAFDPSPASVIRLGGIDIPHTRKLLGHSDADVILHAITDALLGTIGDGDIGQIFPPSDQTWKNADSRIFIQEALRRVRAKGGTIIHADISLVAEEPKIGPHRDAMQKKLAEILNLPTTRIGLKATTSEGLGFVGERKGIEAKAVVSVSLPADRE
jgi:2-C-methyl-D-erythritol 4-phosphate cytidylyltransferase/2-C-methyl-D-erythritol 2,4-cyclodiphosphate synthase